MAEESEIKINVNIGAISINAVLLNYGSNDKGILYIKHGEKILHHKLLGVAGLYNQYNYEEERREWLTTLGDHFDRLGGANP